MHMSMYMSGLSRVIIQAANMTAESVVWDIPMHKDPRELEGPVMPLTHGVLQKGVYLVA